MAKSNFCFVLIICRTDIKDIDGKIKGANSHVEDYCKQQNLGSTNNGNMKNPIFL